MHLDVPVEWKRTIGERNFRAVSGEPFLAKVSGLSQERLVNMHGLNGLGAMNHSHLIVYTNKKFHNQQHRSYQCAQHHAFFRVA
ncbi:hypothetical protein ACQUFY_25425 (plasmid) [Robbsia andropogonis]|uniref:hypothetical protein n=1 Tax=Robbsia andropogonis TaxID=28092 RepID=UPI003D199AA5